LLTRPRISPTVTGNEGIDVPAPSSVGEYWWRKPARLAESTGRGNSQFFPVADNPGNHCRENPEKIKKNPVL